MKKKWQNQNTLSLKPACGSILGPHRVLSTKIYFWYLPYSKQANPSKTVTPATNSTSWPLHFDVFKMMLILSSWGCCEDEKVKGSQCFMEEVAARNLWCPAGFLQCYSCLSIKLIGGTVQALGEAKASSPSKGGALKWPKQAHTIRPLEIGWDFKGKAEGLIKWTGLKSWLSSLLWLLFLIAELTPLQLTGKMGTELPYQSPEQRGRERKHRWWIKWPWSRCSRKRIGLSSPLTFPYQMVMHVF